MFFLLIALFDDAFFFFNAHIVWKGYVMLTTWYDDDDDIVTDRSKERKTFTVKPMAMQTRKPKLLNDQVKIYYGYYNPF